MALLTGRRQGSIAPLVRRGDVDVRHGQEQADDIDVAIIGGDVDRGLALLVGLVGLNPVRAKQFSYDVQVAILARDVQWCGSSVLGLVGLNPVRACLLYTSPSPRDKRQSRMPSSA